MTKPKPAPKPAETTAKPAPEGKPEDAGQQDAKKEDTPTPMDTEGDAAKGGAGPKVEPVDE